MGLWQILFKKPFRQELQPVFLPLILGTLLASISSIATIYVAWCIIALISDYEHTLIGNALIGLIISGIALGASSHISHMAELKFSYNLRQKVLFHIFRLPKYQSSKIDEHQFRQYLIDDISNLHYLVAHLPNEFIVFVVAPLTALSLLVKVAGVNVLIALLPAVLASCYYLIVIPRVIKKDGAARMQTMQSVISAVEDYTKGIRLYRSIPSYKEQFDLATKKFGLKMTSWVLKVVFLASIATALLQIIPTYAIIYSFVSTREIQVVLASLIFGVAAIYPASRLAHGLDYVHLAKSSAKNLANFLDSAQLPSGTQNDIEFQSIKLVNLSIKVDDHCLIGQLNYTFKKGELITISGISGGGKSTLLQMMAGNAEVSYGQILYGKTPIEHMSDVARHRTILLISQGLGMPPMTVCELFKLVDSDYSDDECLQMLQSIDLEMHLHTVLTSLSGGERQKVLLLVACICKADVLLFDETMSALDGASAQKFIDILKDLAHQKQKIIILISHESWVSKLSDRHLDLNDFRFAENTRS